MYRYTHLSPSLPVIPVCEVNTHPTARAGSGCEAREQASVSRRGPHFIS